MRIVGLCGSLRAASKNRMLMHEAARLAEATHFEEADLRFPLFDEDVEALGIPEPVQRLADQIEAADAVLMVTPEYNKGMSGVLKNALDWLSRVKTRPLTNKPTAIMSSAAGRAGGERGQAMLRQALVAFRVRLAVGPEIHVGAHANEYDDNGRLSGERYRKELTQLMDALRRDAGHG